MLGNNTRAGLTEAAQYFISKMFNKIDSNGLPEQIKKATTQKSPIIKENKGSVDIEISLKPEDEGGAPMARAFEYGSGIRAERGSKEKYLITPDKAPALTFLWKYPSPLGLKEKPYDEWVSFQKVMHPGVAPRPYIRPTLAAEKEQIKKILGKAFKADILLGKDRITIIK